MDREPKRRVAHRTQGISRYSRWRLELRVKRNAKIARAPVATRSAAASSCWVRLNPVACAPAPGEDDGGDQEDAQDVAAPPEGPVVPEGAEPEGRGEPEEPDGRVHHGTDDRAESDQAPDLAHGRQVRKIGHPPAHEPRPGQGPQAVCDGVLDGDREREALGEVEGPARKKSHRHESGPVPRLQAQKGPQVEPARKPEVDEGPMGRGDELARARAGKVGGPECEHANGQESRIPRAGGNHRLEKRPAHLRLLRRPKSPCAGAPPVPTAEGG